MKREEEKVLLSGEQPNIFGSRKPRKPLEEQEGSPNYPQVTPPLQREDDEAPMDTAFDPYSPGDMEVVRLETRKKADYTRTEVWNGSIQMGEKLRFQTFGFPLVGSESAAEDLREQIPGDLKIIGRIPPPVVWGYVKVCRAYLGSNTFWGVLGSRPKCFGIF